MTKVKEFIMGAVLLLGLSAVPAVVGSSLVGAQNFNECEGIQGCVGGGSQAVDESGGGDAEVEVVELVQLIVNIFSWIVGIVAVIMIIIGGLRYITSGGDANNVTSAKNTILYAIIGLIIVVLAQVIVRFVLAQFDIT